MNFILFTYFLLLVQSATITDCYSNEIFKSTEAICESCSAGTEPNSDKTECVPCAAGYYSTSNSVCMQCIPGTYSEIGSQRCTLCAEGYNASEYASTFCTECKEPFIADKHHQYCTLCPNRTKYVGYKTKVLPCEYCGKNQISVENNTKCKPCLDTERVINNECVPRCTDSIKENCFEYNCTKNEYLLKGDCEPCPSKAVCVDGIKTDCETLKNSICVDNKIIECRSFIDEPNNDYTECEISKTFITVITIVSFIVVAIIAIVVVFLITRFVVQKKVIDFSQNNAQETDPTKVYLLSF